MQETDNMHTYRKEHNRKNEETFYVNFNSLSHFFALFSHAFQQQQLEYLLWKVNYGICYVYTKKHTAPAPLFVIYIFPICL
jgi:hypothetical protein